jgi:hypothetical protein
MSLRLGIVPSWMGHLGWQIGRIGRRLGRRILRTRTLYESWRVLWYVFYECRKDYVYL